MLLLKIFFCFLLVTTAYGQNILRISDGKIKGRTLQTKNNNTFYAYQQIPFAEPPVGNLRFEPPVRAKKWDGVLDCTNNTKICVQFDPTAKPNPLETEDCLYLNVYTPVNPGANKSLPVIFYIHGGAFIRRSGIFNEKGPHYFMDNNVVLVTVEYRMGPLGFISTSDLVIPGNNGLKDQRLGLKWVQNNIRYFGGDPTKVTLLGESAGGGSVAYQLMDKKPSGLFRGAILQSGSSLVSGFYNPNPRTSAFALASKFNFTGTTSEELKEFLRHPNAVDIKEASEELGGHFSPVIEQIHRDAIITESMYTLVETGNFNRVPIIMGVASEESISQNANPNFPKSMQKFDENPSLLVNDNFNINDSDTKALLGKKIREIYTNGSFADNALASISYSSDNAITRPSMRFGELYSKFADVYFYKFSYSGPLGQNDVEKIPGAGKVTHAEDINYLWVTTNGNDSAILDYPKQDQLISELYVKLFSNFAKNLTPIDSSIKNLTWPKLVPGSFKYLNINDTVEMDVNPRGDHYEKWVELYDKYAIKPLYTY